MEKLAWVEILDREGDSTSRHPITGWPFVVGRGYQCDLILDDPHIAALHAEITELQPGQYQLRDLGSINGITPFGNSGKTHNLVVQSDEKIRLGQTQLRIRSTTHPVAPEIPLSLRPWSRKPATLAASAGLSLFFTCMAGWSMYDNADALGDLSKTVLGIVFMLIAWVAVWALISRLFTSKTNLIAHGIIASTALNALWILDYGSSFTEFSLDSTALSSQIDKLEYAALAVTLYFHLRLISRINKGHIAAIATLIGVSLWGTTTLTASLDEHTETANYNSTIEPPALLLKNGMSIDAFIESATTSK